MITNKTKFSFEELDNIIDNYTLSNNFDNDFFPSIEHIIDIIDKKSLTTSIISDKLKTKSEINRYISQSKELFKAATNALNSDVPDVVESKKAEENKENKFKYITQLNNSEYSIIITTMFMFDIIYSERGILPFYNEILLLNDINKINDITLNIYCSVDYIFDHSPMAIISILSTFFNILLKTSTFKKRTIIDTNTNIIGLIIAALSDEIKIGSFGSFAIFKFDYSIYSEKINKIIKSYFSIIFSEASNKNLLNHDEIDIFLSDDKNIILFLDAIKLKKRLSI